MWIITVLQVAAVLSVLFLEHKKPGEALLWVLVIVLMPVVGLLAYLALGSTVGIKLAYWTRSRRLTETYMKILEAQIARTKDLPEMHDTPARRTVRRTIQFHLNYCHSLLTRHNEVEILTTGRAKYDRLFADLREAKDSINIAYYAIHNDVVGQELADILAEKAMQGVRVRLLYDRFGSIATPNKLFRPLEQAGGHVRRAKPTVTHFRNHRKIVVIDGHIGYTGGMNIGTKYLGERKKKSPWRDTQIRMRGEAVWMLQYYFLYDWFFVNREGKAGIGDDEAETLFPPSTVREELPCQVFGSGVETVREEMKLSMLRLISGAREHIWIQSPYFIPSESIMEALQVALASGVEVWIMLPGRRSSFFLEPTTNYYVDRLLPYGARVFLYDGYLHAKTIAIDEDITAIGSVNMDIRSLEVDDEVQAVFYGENFSERHKEVFRADLEHCTEMDYETFRNRPMRTRIKERVFQLFSPLM